MLEQSDKSIHPSIFRAYDIRGIVNKTLREIDIYLLGKAIGTKAIRKGERSIAIARDGRLSSPLLHAALSDGLLSTGVDVIDLGMVPTPLLYYATHNLETRSGVMLTGSHNPAEYNGLKMIVNGETLAETGIQELYQAIITKDFLQGEGQLSELDMVERYLTHVARDVRLPSSLKIVIDCGNGVAGSVAPELFRRLGAEVIELFCEIDGNFPNHHPDPSSTENLQSLIQKVKETGADIGLAFDGDGDRLGVVTNEGEIIWPDRQLMLFARSILRKEPLARIIYDVKCTRHLAEMIKAWGGEPIMWKTGHSLIKSKLIETQAALAGEMSGHIFFKDQWYGFDDAIYAGARLLQILSMENKTSSALFREIPNSINTPELKIYVEENEKFELMNALIQKANFTSGENITIDGLRVNFADGWGLVRPSNTTPCLVLRFEADSETVLKRIQDLFRDLLFSVKPDLEIPF